MAAFQAKEFLPARALTQVTDLRISNPGLARNLATGRKRRETLAPDGRLHILAADHPARAVTQVRDNPLAMADRHDYLGRILRVLSSDATDGIMATMDILEDLLLLDHLIAEAGGNSFLADKLLIPSMNRGGLYGAKWELLDPITGATPSTCDDWNMDGGKLLLRVCSDNEDSLFTMTECAQAITEMNALGLPTFLEPLPVEFIGNQWQVIKEPGTLARIIGVATALGDSSSGIWLKLPVCEDYDRVASATTLPIVVLGGPALDNPEPMLRDISRALDAGSNIRGALIGRNVLFPGDQDPQALAMAVHGMVHRGLDVEAGIALAREEHAMDAIRRWFE